MIHSKVEPSYCQDSLMGNNILQFSVLSDYTHRGQNWIWKASFTVAIITVTCHCSSRRHCNRGGAAAFYGKYWTLFPHGMKALEVRNVKVDSVYEVTELNKCAECHLNWLDRWVLLYTNKILSHFIWLVLLIVSWNSYLGWWTRGCKVA